MKQFAHSISAMSNSIFPLRAVSSQRSYIRVLVLIALTLVICSINTQQINAATFIVTTNADPDNTAGSCAANGTCSLRQAVNAANATAGDDTINFAAGLANQIITLTVGLNDIDITSNTVIDATGVNGIKVSGANAIRVFLITGATVTLRGFTIRDGNSNGSNSFAGTGGGIKTDNSFLTLDNVVITNSFGDATGGGGIAADSGGSLVVTNSTISNNTGNNSGGGILLGGVPNLSITNSIITNNTAANSEGGGISATRGIPGVSIQITLIGVQLTNNHADNNPSGSGGGIIVASTNVLTVTNCTVSGNTSFTRGGGVYILGGATHRIYGTTFSGNTSSGNGGGLVALNGATVNMVNSTFSGNRALNGSGIYDDISGGSGGQTTLRNVTVAGNTATTGQGGGIFSNGGTITLANTIVSDSVNNANAPIPDLAGTINSLGNNLFENVGAANINGTTTGNQTGIDPMLGALQNNGGTTLTRALLTGSSAIDAGSNAQALGTDNTTPLARDQRGFMRIVDGDGNSTVIVDIGAYEFNAAPTAASVTIGGRVLDIRGRGINRARVNLTDQNGETRAALTNSFGFYYFADVSAGQTYIFSVRHKQYTFAPQVLNVTEEIGDLNFTAQP